MEARTYPPSPSHDFAHTLIDVLAEHGRHRPDALAYTFLADGETIESQITYAELETHARAIGATLQQLGAQGERVMLLYPTGVAYVAAFLGCLYAGSVAVPMFPPPRKRLSDRLQTVVADAQATFALTTARLMSQAQVWQAHTPGLQALHWLATDTIDPVMQRVWERPQLDADTIAFLQYTSGSTAAPKGVMVSHGNLMHNERMLQQAYEHNAETVCVSWLPLYHDMGLIGNVLQTLYVGGHCILMTPAAFVQHPVRWLQAISRFRAHTSGGPNFAYDLCVQKIVAEQRAALDLSHWSLAFSGAEPIRCETLERFAEMFAPCGFRRETLYPAYGLAEATLMVTGGCKAEAPVVHAAEKAALAQHRLVSAHANDAEARPLVGCGHARLEQQIRIVDPVTRRACAPGQVGEIWVAGPSVARGYWNQPEATAQTFQAHLADTGEGPFLRTGDLGYLHHAELFITGRLKDVMIIRGNNHYPQDIEKTVEESHAALRPGCGAAFSVDVEGEERLVVVQELERNYRSKLSPKRDVKEVIAAVRQAITEAHGLQVHAVLLLRTASLPKTTSGKIQRQASKVGFLTRSLNVMCVWHAMPTPNRHAQLRPIPARVQPLSAVYKRRCAPVEHTVIQAECGAVALAA